MNTLHLVTLSGRRISLPSPDPQSASAWLRKAESRGPAFRSAVFHSQELCVVVKKTSNDREISPR